MLGRLRRTTRVDVGLALAFSGAAYLVWSLVAGVSRQLMQEMIQNIGHTVRLEKTTALIKVFFVEGGFVIDLVGLAWLVGCLILILLASRQRISVSWAWMCAICQSLVAALGGALVAWAVQRPYVTVLSGNATDHPLTATAQISMVSLPIVITVALLIWVTFVVWLLVERARLNRRGPSLTDGLRTNVYR